MDGRVQGTAGEMLPILVDTEGRQIVVATVSGSGGGLTDTELRLTPVPVSGTVSPSMSSGVHVSAQTAATGSNWTAFGSQACKQLTVHNNTGTVVEVSVGGAGVGIPIQTGMFYTLFGLTNASALSIRRVDQSNTQVTVQARAES